MLKRLWEKNNYGSFDGDIKEGSETNNTASGGSEVVQSELYPEFSIYFDKISIPIFIWHPFKNNYTLVYNNKKAEKFQNGILKDFFGNLLSPANSTHHELLIDFNDCLSNKITIRKEIKILAGEKEYKFLVEFQQLHLHFVLVQVLESIPEFDLEGNYDLIPILDLLPASIIITNRDSEILFTNKKFSEITGYSAEEVYRKNPRILKSGNKTSEQYKELWETILSGKEWKGEFLNKKKNGELFWESAVISPVKNLFEEINHFIAVKSDITENKKSEEDLRIIEKLATIGKMTTYISHEIRSPLTSIKLNIDILSKKLELDKTQTKLFGIIKKEINRLDTLLKEILQFSQNKKMVNTKININKLIENVGILINPLLSKNNIKFINITKKVYILGNDSRMQSLFLHLFENSIDAIKENGIIEVYSEDEKNSNKISIFIKDTGNGIKEPQKIFDPFYTTKTAGTGLGLAIVKKIVESNQGTIELVSSKKHETTFKLCFPIVVK